MGGITQAFNPAGSDTEIQYNDNGILSGSPSLTYNGSNLTVDGSFNGGNISAFSNITWLRNGLNAQQMSIFNTYTDGSNNESFRMYWSSNVLNIATSAVGTGVNRDIAFVPGGSARLRIGTFNALAGEVLNGYFLVKDLAGNTRKLAIIA